MTNEIVELTQQMVAIPSVNPQEKELTEKPYGEAAMVAFIADWLDKAGLQPQVQPVRPPRNNVLALARGLDPSKTLLLSAHMDTVDVKDMTIDPFDPQLRDGRIYGRGSCDDKGPMATLMIAFRDRVKQGNLPYNLALLASCGEEYDMIGARSCAEKMGSELSAVILAEPTEFNIVVAHKGVVRLKVITTGKSAHSSRPELGRNAIYTMARALLLIEKYAHDLSLLPGHPRLKTETLSATIVNGGQQINVIPDRCEARIDWRILPGRSPQKCLDELNAALQAELNDPITVELINQYESMETPEDHPLIKALLNVAKKTVDSAETIVAGFATDASAFNRLGIPTPVFGPGCNKKAHTQDEYVEVEQLEKGLKAYKSFLQADWGI